MRTIKITFIFVSIFLAGILTGIFGLALKLAVGETTAGKLLAPYSIPIIFLMGLIVLVFILAIALELSKRKVKQTRW